MNVYVKYNSNTNSWALIDGEKVSSISKFIMSHGVKTWVLPENSSGRAYLSDDKIADGLELTPKQPRSASSTVRTATPKTDSLTEQAEKYLTEPELEQFNQLIAKIKTAAKKAELLAQIEAWQAELEAL